MNLFFAASFSVTTLVLLIGLGYKIYQYSTTKAELRIPTTPAPTNIGGVWLRMMREVLLFQSLFKSNIWIWILGWSFHASLVIVLARHLRYFQEQPWLWVVWIQPYGRYAAYPLLIGLVGLLLRRIILERVRYISNASDYLMLILLILIAASGLVLQLLVHPDILGLRAFFIGLFNFSLQPLPSDLVLYLHLFLVTILLIVFPFSKLLHAPGVFFSPTINQIDKPRNVN